jgi:hypothetical protein
MNMIHIPYLAPEDADGRGWPHELKQLKEFGIFTGEFNQVDATFPVRVNPNMNSSDASDAIEASESKNFSPFIGSPKDSVVKVEDKDWNFKVNSYHLSKILDKEDFDGTHPVVLQRHHPDCNSSRSL